MTNIFLWLALLLLAALGRYHAAYALGLAVAAIPLYLVRLDVGVIPTNFFELTVMAVVIGTLSQPSWRAQAIAATRALPKPLMVLVLLWVLAAGISTAISAEPRVSLGILKGWILLPLLLGWLVYIAGPAISSKLTNALIGTGVITAAIGLWELIRHFGGPAVLAGQLRVSSIYDVPNSLALWLVPLIVLALWQKTILATAATLLMAAALLLTQSAAGIAALLLTLGIGSALFLNGRQRRVAIAAVVCGAIAATAYLASTGRLAYLASPWTKETSNSISVRGQLWSISLDLIKANPLLGVGLGQFEPAYQQKLHELFQQFENCELSATSADPPAGEKIENCMRPLAEYVFRDPHNWILSMWLNLGLLGLISFFGIHLWLFWRVLALHPIPYSLQPIFLALVSLLIFGLVDTIHWKNDLAALHWLLIVLLHSQLLHHWQVTKA